MKNKITVTKKQIKHIANLANMPVTIAEQDKFSKAIEETLDTIAELRSVDVSDTEPTHQVTGLENIFREDVIDSDSMFTQDQAIANAKQAHNGFFVVPRIIEEK